MELFLAASDVEYAVMRESACTYTLSHSLISVVIDCSRQRSYRKIDWYNKHNARLTNRTALCEAIRPLQYEYASASEIFECGGEELRVYQSVYTKRGCCHE